MTMEVTHGTPGGGALSAIDDHWVLTLDAATGRFARRFTFALATGGLADAFRWQQDSGCTLSFPTYDYDARAAGAPEGVTLAGAEGNGVKVTFPAARSLLRVKIAGALSTDAVEARRVDGDVITEDAFTSASHGTSGAELHAVDRQLVLRQVRAGTAIPLPTTNVQNVFVRSVAANIRVGVVLPDLSPEVFYLGPDAGTVMTSPATASDVGPALAAVLQGACDRLTDSLEGATLPASVAMTLVLESDTPARASISAFVLRYRLHRERFDDQAPRRVLDFSGQELVTRSLTIDVPRGAALWSATLRMMGPFHEQAGEDPSEGGNSGEAPGPAVQASDVGVAIAAGESVATRAQLAQAALLQGATVDLVAAADASAATVRVHRDEGGQPGEALCEGTLAPMRAGARGVVRADFTPPAVAGAGPAWVVVQCDRGALVWVTALPSDATAGMQVLRRAAGDPRWTGVGAAADRGGMVSFVTPSEVSGSGSGADQAFHGVRLRLGGVRLRGSPSLPGSAGEKETRFSIATALTPIVQPAPAGTLVPVVLSMVSSERGRVTVYPPAFEFDA
jgi:hypothetical protein